MCIIHELFDFMKVICIEYQSPSQSVIFDTWVFDTWVYISGDLRLLSPFSTSIKMADRIHFCLLAIFLVFAEASRSAIDGKIFPFLFIASHCPMKNFVNSNSLPAG